jgi:hypothetical protein
MLDCSAREGVKCDPKSDERHKPICGSDLAFPYFISFYVLCSFLVSESMLSCEDIHKILMEFFADYSFYSHGGIWDCISVDLQPPFGLWIINR